MVCLTTTGKASPAEAGWLGQLRRVPGITAEVLRPVDVAGFLTRLDHDARTPTPPALDLGLNGWLWLPARADGWLW